MLQNNNLENDLHNSTDETIEIDLSSSSDADSLERLVARDDSESSLYKLTDIRNKIILGNAFEELKKIPDKSISMCMTSPPYWQVRDYKIEAQIFGGDHECLHEWDEQETGLMHENRNFQKGSQEEVNENGKGTTWIKKYDKVQSAFCTKCSAWLGQHGLEPELEHFIDNLVSLFDEVKRTLADWGTCWVNLGDTYNSSPSGLSSEKLEEYEKQEHTDGNFSRIRTRSVSGGNNKTLYKNSLSSLPRKCLLGIPMRFAIAMIDRGWVLRNRIIWHKPNPVPSSAKDRFTVDFEEIFLFAKKPKYYFEQQFDPYDKPLNRWGGEEYKGSPKFMEGDGTHGQKLQENIMSERNSVRPNPLGKNKRTTWTISPRGFDGAHFAVYPEELVETPIKAGCPRYVCTKCGKPRRRKIKSDWRKKRDGTWKDAKELGSKMDRIYQRQEQVGGLLQIKEPSIRLYDGWKECGCKEKFEPGIVLDPFAGSGTTLAVAKRLRRDYIGIEVKPEYLELATKRIKETAQYLDLEEYF